MAGWLQKLLEPPRKNGQLPVQRRGGSLPTRPNKPTQRLPDATLPNATVIYGVGAAFMFVAAFFLLTAGRWFPALIVLAVGACLVGFALHLLKHQD